MWHTMLFWAFSAFESMVFSGSSSSVILLDFISCRLIVFGIEIPLLEEALEPLDMVLPWMNIFGLSMVFCGVLGLVVCFDSLKC